jgi:RHS repeat-associated protein
MLKTNEIAGEGNSFSTEFRQYDPRLGKWLSLDPLMEQFAWMSPFVGYDNNPILYVDPYGLESTTEGDEKKKDGDKKGAEKENKDSYIDKDGKLIPDKLGLPDNPEEGKTYKGSNGKNYSKIDGTWNGTTEDAEVHKGTSKEKKNDSYKGFKGVNLNGFAEGFSSRLTDFKVSFYDPNSKGSDLDNWLLNLGSAYSLTVQWSHGIGFENSQYTNDRIANSMKNAWRVNQAREFYYKKYEGQDNLANTQVTGFKGTFGYLGLLHAGIDPIEQFVGGCRISIYNLNGKTLKFVITNETSMNSFLYDLGPSWSRNNRFNFKPGSSVFQTYTWTEPIKE